MTVDEVAGVEARVERDGAWVRLVMSARPGNVMSLALVRALDKALADVEGMRGVKWLTVEGQGPDFSFGARIQEHLPEPMREVLPETHALVRRLLAIAVPTAALVEGRCLGGGFELALACDDIIAADEAVFALPEISLAAFPPVAAALLPLRVGTSRAARAIVTGDAQPAAYWRDAGLVSLASPGMPVAQAARAWFDRHFASRSAVALAHAARAARLTLSAAALPALEAAERAYLDALLSHPDAREGVQAWIDKRAPAWEHGV